MFIELCCRLLILFPLYTRLQIYPLTRSEFDIGFAMRSSPDDSNFDSREKGMNINPADLYTDPEKLVDVPKVRQDAFGDEEFAEVKYKTLKWWYVFKASCFVCA